jgi:spore coat polysaccharide biosynthesis protein SpsF
MYTAIVQARMGSTRLPGKIMMSVRDKPLLHYNIRQVLQSKKIEKLIIATTDLPQDDKIVKFVDLYGIEVFRGNEEDVLDRYFHCAKEFKLDVIVRITSDCPLIDPEIIDECVKKFENGNFDYLSNVHKKIDGDWIYDPCGFPHGFAVEVFTFNALENAWKNAKKSSDREHVTQYILDNSKKFKIGGLENQENFSDLRLTLDYQVDFNLIKIIIEKFPINEIFTLKKIVSFFNNSPEFKKINSNIPFNDGYLKSLINNNSDPIDKIPK